MNEVFIVTPADVTLEMIGDVLRRRWSLDKDLAQPHVELQLGTKAYVAEVDAATMDDPLFFHAGERERLRDRIGDYRIFSVRYTSPSLGRDVARAIASSELAQQPMLLDYADTFLPPRQFIEQAARQWPPTSVGAQSD